MYDAYSLHWVIVLQFHCFVLFPSNHSLSHSLSNASQLGWAEATGGVVVLSIYYGAIVNPVLGGFQAAFLAIVGQLFKGLYLVLSFSYTFREITTAEERRIAWGSYCQWQIARHPLCVEWWGRMTINHTETSSVYNNFGLPKKLTRNPNIATCVLSCKWN